MAETLPIINTSNITIVDLLNQQSNLLEEIKTSITKSTALLTNLTSLTFQSVQLDEQRLALDKIKTQNEAFALDEAKREAQRERNSGLSQIVSKGAELAGLPSLLAGPLGELIPSLTAGIGGGLAAGALASGSRSFVKGLVGRGGLVGLGAIFGEQIGTFLGNEAGAALEELGVDPGTANTVEKEIAENMAPFLVFRGLLGKTLPAFIATLIFDQLGLMNLFSEEGRQKINQELRELTERVADGEATEEDIANILTGGAAIAAGGALAARPFARVGERIAQRLRERGAAPRPGGPPPAAAPSMTDEQRRAQLEQMSDDRLRRLGFERVEGTGRIRRLGQDKRFVSFKTVEEAIEKAAKNEATKRTVKNILKVLGPVGIVFTVYEILQIINILEDPALSDKEKAEDIALIIGPMLGGLSGAVLGAMAGGAFGGPWGAFFGGLVGGVSGSTLAYYIVLWAINPSSTPPNPYESPDSIIERPEVIGRLDENIDSGSYLTSRYAEGAYASAEVSRPVRVAALNTGTMTDAIAEPTNQIMQQDVTNIKLKDMSEPQRQAMVNAIQVHEGWFEGSRSFRNNNPGNIEYGNFAITKGAVRSDGRFAIFPDYQTGRNALYDLLFNTQTYPQLTVAQAIRRYAPATENATESYVAAIESAVGRVAGGETMTQTSIAEASPDFYNRPVTGSVAGQPMAARPEGPAGQLPQSISFGDLSPQQVGNILRETIQSFGKVLPTSRQVGEMSRINAVSLIAPSIVNVDNSTNIAGQGGGRSTSPSAIQTSMREGVLEMFGFGTMNNIG